MHTTTEIPTDEAERTAGILEDRHAARAAHPAGTHLTDEPADAAHLTTQARRLVDIVVATFTADNPGHWERVASDLTDDPAILDRFAATHGLPRPIDAVKCRVVALVKSKALADTLSPIRPASQRPKAETVGWLADNPEHAAQMEYLDGTTGQWRPTQEAVDTIDPGWCVEVRQAMHVVGA